MQQDAHYPPTLGAEIKRQHHALQSALLRPREAAHLLGLGVSTLAKRRMSGDSPPWCRIGRAVRYRRDDLIAWADAHKRRSTSDNGGAK